MNEKIGFIGLGIMGQGMVRNLLDKGFVVYIWNRTHGKMDPFIEHWALSPPAAQRTWPATPTSSSPVSATRPT
jgi:3-hydroxyisobutyrate dehydrogenase-like beta-hydroxyacid dehydrogenase